MEVPKGTNGGTPTKLKSASHRTIAFWGKELGGGEELLYLKAPLVCTPRYQNEYLALPMGIP